MRLAAILMGLFCCTLASGCGEEPAPPDQPASPEVIRQLARQERSVEEFDVCEALKATRSHDELVRLAGSGSISIDGGFVDNEDAAVADCNVSPEGNRDLGLRVSLNQGTEFRGAEQDDPVVFAGCRVASPASSDSTTWVRVTCRPDLTVDAVLTSDDHATVEPDTLVDLLHDVLVNVSQQGWTGRGP